MFVVQNQPYNYECSQNGALFTLIISPVHIGIEEIAFQSPSNENDGVQPPQSLFSAKMYSNVDLDGMMLKESEFNRSSRFLSKLKFF